MDNPLDRISNQMISRYSQRYREMGNNVKTLGWGNVEQQQFRFKQAIDQVNFDLNKSVLDIGCGFGDLLALLISENKPFKKYIGWDINPDLVNESIKIWSNNKTSSQFEVLNIGNKNFIEPIADIGFMFGVLNLNLKEEFNNLNYSKIFIKNAFSAVRETLVVDFLSSQVDHNYPKEDFVYYHNPTEILEFALTLTPNVVLKHNYSPIPQKEFMLFLYK
jgi:SAM-dependent methyltransferase